MSKFILKVDMRHFGKITHIYFDWSGTLAPSGTKKQFINNPTNLDILYPDTIPVLKELRRHGYTLGLIVNTSKRNFRQSLKTSGLLNSLFNGPVILSNDDYVVCKKPCIHIFKKALGRISPNHALMVGNDDIKDIASAKSIGMHTFRVVRHGLNTINLVDLLS